MCWPKKILPHPVVVLAQSNSETPPEEPYQPHPEAELAFSSAFEVADPL